MRNGPSCGLQPNVRQLPIWRRPLRAALSMKLLPELRRGDVREIVHGSYRVIYRTEKARLVMLTVRHVRRLG